MKIEISGNNANVTVLEISGGNNVIHIGANGLTTQASGKSGYRKDRFSGNLTKEQRTQFAAQTSSVQHEAPEGWNIESWTSEKAFTSKPDTLQTGAPIFYWKAGCDANTSVPSGFEASYLSEDGFMIICPCVSEETSEEIDDELVGSGGGDEDSVELPQEIQIDQQVTGDPISEED
jgi:hypothetical protein